MDEEPITSPEAERRLNLAAARRDAQQPHSGSAARATADAGGIDTAQWLLMFLAAGFAWFLGLLADLLIPFITIVVNYLAVLALWMRAKAGGLRPPTFTTATRGLTGAGNESVATIPGSDLVYVLLGGLTPLIYLTALWWNNRPASGSLRKKT